MEKLNSGIIVVGLALSAAWAYETTMSYYLPTQTNARITGVIKSANEAFKTIDARIEAIESFITAPALEKSLAKKPGGAEAKKAK